MTVKESVIEKLVGKESELAAKERVIQELAAALKQIPSDMKRSWTWRVGRLIVGPLSQLRGRQQALQITADRTTSMTAVPRASQSAPESSDRTRLAETAVKELYDSLTENQRKEICFDWDHRDPTLGILRTFVANHWQITRWAIRSDFFTPPQQSLIHEIFKGLVNPDWYSRFLKQLKDDTGGRPWGADQSIAIFGIPGSGRFEFVITGRHLTLRADGNSEERIAFGGPIFYGHAATGFWESARHPGNVFWPQAQHASKVYQMLNGRQRRLALVAHRPDEPGIGFPGLRGQLPGIPVTEMTRDQKHELQQVLETMIEPFRKEDQHRVMQCLQKMGGLDQCALAFYRDGNLAGPDEWDNWRLTGPAFAWFFRGTPHVHVWVHVATDPAVTLNARKGAFLRASEDVRDQRQTAA